jgi:formylmethanofuran dehydrogenase subunit E
MTHVLTCERHQPHDIPNVSYEDISVSVKRTQKALLACREQTVCAVCDELSASVALQETVGKTLCKWLYSETI